LQTDRKVSEKSNNVAQGGAPRSKEKGSSFQGKKFVIPAQAGIQSNGRKTCHRRSMTFFCLEGNSEDQKKNWIPACAGMTNRGMRALMSASGDRAARPESSMGVGMFQ